MVLHAHYRRRRYLPYSRASRPRSRRVALCALTLSLAGTMSCEGFYSSYFGPVGPEAIQPQEPTVEPAVLREPAPPAGEADHITTVSNVSLEKPLPARTERRQVGRASYYCTSLHGAKTASGERYNAQDFTAAHRWLPFGSRVRVTNVRNGQSVVVRINDRGPFRASRIIDLSTRAAQTLGMMQSGTTDVLVEPLTD